MSNEIERKTVTNNQSDAETARLTRSGSPASQNSTQPVYGQLKEGNILNGYRSITYNFTLAGLPSNFLSSPTAYRGPELTLIIAKSGGKGPGAMQGNKLAPGFNQKSPGRFDLFIENVEMTTLMAFSEKSNMTLPADIKFDIIEPYSVNGFMEALNVAAQEAGYVSHHGASFVFKVEFWGIPDSDVNEFKPPEKIPKTERYIPIQISKVEVEVTERGTLYRCQAIPIEQGLGFGQPNKLKKSVNMVGNTVKDILDNLMKNLTDQAKKYEKEGKANVNNFDEYKIKFPTFVPGAGWTGPDNEISKSKVTEILRENTLYKQDDPGTTTKETNYKIPAGSSKHIPRTAQVHFAENSMVHEIVSSVIRDSEYVRDIIKNIDSKKDSNDQIEYFLVRMEVENKEGTYFEAEKRPYQKYTYVVTPYKVHYSKIPMFSNEQYPEEKLAGVTLREYNYIYMGKNVDVLKFRLNFDNLFYEEIPVSTGNKLTPNAKTATTSKPEDGEPKLKDPTKEQAQANRIPLHPIKTDSPQTDVKTSQGMGNQHKDDPYDVLAKNMHDALVNSQAAMLSGELEILGDPFYLVTGGMGNYDPPSEPGNNYVTQNGEANFNYGQVLVSINFRNPIDIGTFDQGGLMYFDPVRVPFSGVYQVTKATHYFKDGVFKQKLDVLRMPGQILKNNDNMYAPVPTTSNPGQRLINNPDKFEASPSGEPPSVPEQRMTMMPAMSDVLNRGVPSAGLPGELSNFTDATGGLGGADMLSDTFGDTPIASLLQSASSVVGQELPTDLTSDLRLNFSGIGEMAQNNLDLASLVRSASNIITSGMSFKDLASSVANSIVNNELTSALNKFNAGSGIGQGASSLVQWAGELTDPTALEVKFGENINPIQLPLGSISNTLGLPTDLGDRSMQLMNNLVDQKANNLVGNIQNNIGTILGTVADPAGIAQRAGINSSRASGLSSKLQSKVVNQITNLIQNIPKDVNIEDAIKSGISFNSITPNSLKNMPPTQPRATASTPRGDVDFIANIFQSKGRVGLENLYNTKNVSNVSSNIAPTSALNIALQNVLRSTEGSLSNLNVYTNGTDRVAINGKVDTANSTLGSIFGNVSITSKGIQGSIGSKLGRISFNNGKVQGSVNTPLGRVSVSDKGVSGTINTPAGRVSVGDLGVRGTVNIPFGQVSVSNRGVSGTINTPAGRVSISDRGVQGSINTQLGRINVGSRGVSGTMNTTMGRVSINDRGVSGSVSSKYGSVSFNRDQITRVIINTSPLAKLIGGKG